MTNSTSGMQAPPATKTDTQRRRESILHVISRAATSLLREKEWRDCLPYLLSQIGHVTSFSRVYVFDVECDHHGKCRPDIEDEWIRDRHQPILNDREMRSFSLRECPLKSWPEQLAHGETIIGTINDFEGEEYEFLLNKGIKTILLAPVFVDGKWWGVLGADDCEKTRPVSRMEIDGMQLAGELLGAAIERQIREKRLRAAEEKSRTLLNASPTMAVLIDGEGKILDLNKRAAKSLGESREKLLGKNSYALFPSEVADYRKIKNQEVIASGEPLYYEDTRNGLVFTNSVHPLFGETKKVEKLAIFSQDITELRKTERLATLGLISSNLAHYIKNVQTALEGSTVLFERSLAQQNREVMNRLWPIVKRSTEKINHLVHEMLTLAKETSGSQDLLNMNELIVNIISDCRHLAEISGIELYLDLQEDLPQVLFDRHQFHDMLLNLVFNAFESFRDADQEDGRISIETESSEDSQQVSLRVGDNGPGISEENQALMFKPFFTTKGSQGTGLGLAVVSRIVEEQQGTISVFSSPDQGTVFVLEFPAGKRQIPEVG